MTATSNNEPANKAKGEMPGSLPLITTGPKLPSDERLRPPPGGLPRPDLSDLKALRPLDLRPYDLKTSQDEILRPSYPNLSPLGPPLGALLATQIAPRSTQDAS